MSEELFRKKSLDKVKSPENLDDYIRVSNPGVWLLLVSVIALLSGAVVWGIWGRVDSTVPAAVVVQNEDAVSYIAETDISSVKVGMTVRFEDQEAVITYVGDKGDKGYVCTLSASSPLKDGIYEGKVIVETFNPISFILN